MNISSLLFRLDHDHFARPPFAREYAWTPAKVRTLFTRLYRGYPLGELILWPAGTATDTPWSALSKLGGPVEYIIDGQKRVAAIYSTIRGRAPNFLEGGNHSPRPLHFHVEDERFEFHKPNMKGDPFWIDLISFFDPDQVGLGKALHALHQTPAGPARLAEHSYRLNRLRGILDRNLHVEYMPANSRPEELVEVFLAANGGG
jgi:Protein of unknown function DUF262